MQIMPDTIAITRLSTRPPLNLHLCVPRGFCAGVERAIKIVQLTLQKYGPPVYVRHAIVHNRYVVESLEAQGTIFVENLNEVPPDTNAPVIFSAHGIPLSVIDEAKKRNVTYIDATCPLVSKVHASAQHLHKQGFEIILIGHRGHPEVIGTMGQVPAGYISLIETLAEARSFTPKDPKRLAVATQTTLSVDDTRMMIDLLKRRFPDIKLPEKEDICYATTNRQNAVKQIAPTCDALMVLGSPDSSNSQRLREVAERAGCKISFLIQRAADIDWKILKNLRDIGLTAGASAPEILVEEVVEAFRERYNVSIKLSDSVEEDLFFNLPREFRDT